MTATSFGLALLSVILNAAAQLLLKAGTKALVPLVLPGAPFTSAWRLLTQPFLVAGVACCVLGLMIWVVVLSQVPVSIAYPLLSLGYVLNAFLAFHLFGEPLTPMKLIGVGVILVGVLLITRPVTPAGAKAAEAGSTAASTTASGLVVADRPHG